MFIQPMICNMARVETLHNLARYVSEGGFKYKIIELIIKDKP